MWKPVEANLDGVHFEQVRKHRDLDKRHKAVHDELSDAYYNYWRYGKSKRFQGYDVCLSPAESKEQFDRLHALLTPLYDKSFHENNLTLPAKNRLAEEQYNLTEDETGHIVQKHVVATTRIAQYKAQGYEITVQEASAEPIER